MFYHFPLRVTTAFYVVFPSQTLNLLEHVSLHHHEVSSRAVFSLVLCPGRSAPTMSGESMLRRGN